MRALLDLLVPSSCDGCGRAAPPPWCDACDDELRSGRPTTPCPACADGRWPGHPCWAGPAPVAGLVTLGPWRGGVARSVTRAKLVGRREVLLAAGRRLGAAARLAGVVVDGVVAVPTDRRRARRRGRDHTRDLAAGVAPALGAPVLAPFASVTGSPDRTGRGGRTTATAVPPPRVAVVAPAHVAGRRIALVDDVVTTGATLAAAASALSAAGAREVVGLAVGRAGGHVLTADGGGPAVRW